MLEIVKYGEDEYDFPCLLVLGCFDGLHIGHAELLKKAKLQAKINGLDLGVMMFTDGKGGKQLYSFEERISFLEQYNVKFVLKIVFDDEFKDINPLDFLACIEDKLNVKAYMSGKDFRFGKDKKGKSSTLKSYAEDEENGVWYMPVKDVVYGSEKVSTTQIKSLLAQGNLKLANELLGKPYSVTGKIVHGADRGGKVLGCPTINVVYPDYKFEIQQGVYQVSCRIEDKSYTGVANYGARPTFGENEVLLEVNLNDCSEDLYDKTATVEFIDYIRDIEKFDSAEQLSEQIQKDKQAQDELAVTEDVQTAETVSSEVTVEPVQETVESAGENVVGAETDDTPLITVTDIISDTNEEIAERPYDQKLAELIEEMSAEPVEEIAEEIPAEPVEDVTEEIAVEPVEEIAEETPAEPVEEVTEEFPVEIVEEVTEETPAEPVEEVTEEIAVEPVEDIAEETPAEPVEEVIEEIPAETVEEIEDNVTLEEIEQANDEFYDELEEEIEISKEELKEVEAHSRRRLKNVIEEIKLEGDKTEQTEDVHSEIIEEGTSEQDEDETIYSEEGNND